ncbi:hypothetical protein A1Q1_01249 [Trichosporon asahii var. asahii CBS 2479]|uniref:Uncharacterized protein n=1 Tax=Trichosporon asahii var. asahii (strain ATCC 90039 / CBS 2479 / JCM 2466 / KCTC 7840 / NBRC 103889/ NCYC 2677 / UAMH 7654) TaxID=1186058 RepID=J4UEF7_TRIAS|nr:hypothetical protein A1Q1_01249 [Trichosporon asahii var. asahii CBS 2479]EJT49620.1 hypothetical protein A1Q1_01249 [Trichosporon asahii var. asahii CBS 2479]
MPKDTKPKAHPARQPPSSSSRPPASLINAAGSPPSQPSPGTAQLAPSPALLLQRLANVDQTVLATLASQLGPEFSADSLKSLATSSETSLPSPPQSTAASQHLRYPDEAPDAHADADHSHPHSLATQHLQAQVSKIAAAPGGPPSGPPYGINRWISTPERTPPSMEDEIAELVVADMLRELDNKDPSTYVVTVRSGSAEEEFAKWKQQPRVRRRLPSGATFIDPRSFVLDLVSGKTDHLVLDEAIALSVNPSIMMPIVASVGRRPNGTVTILREGCYQAATLSIIQNHFHQWVVASLMWCGPGGLQRSDSDRRRRQELALVHARYDLLEIDFSNCSSEARLVQRWHAALFWRRANSQVRQYALAPGLSDVGCTDGSRWPKPRPTLRGMRVRHNIPEGAAEATGSGDELLDDALGDDDAGGDNNTGDNDDTGGDARRLLVPVDWVYMHSVGWCEFDNCPATEPQECKVMMVNGKIVEVCHRCADIIRNPERYK